MEQNKVVAWVLTASVGYGAFVLWREEIELSSEQSCAGIMFVSFVLFSWHIALNPMEEKSDGFGGFKLSLKHIPGLLLSLLLLGSGLLLSMMG